MIFYPTILKTYYIGTTPLEIFVPDPVSLVAQYKKENKGAGFLYWAKVWPAAIGLCTFLHNNLSYIEDKKVLELAAGPGLPGIFCATYAKQVCISDIEAEAVAMIQQTITHHQLKNTECSILDWNNLIQVPIPEIVLLSDINYNPAQFEELLLAVNYLLSNGCCIILSTPQRLMAKDFIQQILVFCKEQTEIEVEMENGKTNISVFVLKK